MDNDNEYANSARLVKTRRRATVCAHHRTVARSCWEASVSLSLKVRSALSAHRHQLSQASQQKAPRSTFVAAPLSPQAFDLAPWVSVAPLCWHLVSAVYRAPRFCSLHGLLDTKHVACSVSAKRKKRNNCRSESALVNGKESRPARLVSLRWTWEMRGALASGARASPREHTFQVAQERDLGVIKRNA